MASMWRGDEPRVTPGASSRTVLGVPRFDPVGLQEIAERLGVKPATPVMWHQRGLLPPPQGTVSGRPCWNWPTIEKWARKTGRLNDE